MPGLREVQYYLAGLWLLIRLDPRGFRFLDISERGVNRSFWAIAWCLPPMGISWLWLRQAFLRLMPPNADVGFAFYFRLGLVEVANWFVPLVFAGLLMLAFRMGERFAPVVVSVNWLWVPLSYIDGLLLALVFFLPGAVGFVSLLGLAFMLARVFVLARILRMICQGHALMVGALTLVLLVPSMILSEYLQHFLGIFPI
ncbi:hypothetical protein FHS26_000340 [Rhizobium pisi]|jgi:hypothetical protein|uniref:Yip1 domain-containing protein n=2 Tax=Rhizobium TaxID=379 RepID=A0A7W6FK20_9HYPH|nr:MULTISPECIES: hypothetical protein [Rhizobium]MBB3132645.1 hypothetical protein [Rhizobium pisi]MBB3916444.1 hypothetical protein [Rhizobium fabae]RSB86502.1 hypothetical protein EFD55_00865 [Rhizobium pisi]RUM13126.1 hypothetical protein EFB14_12565 [Rhizobium fabae]TCA63039.1 hypothetical protein E0J16_01825 [Rhizobium pisi]